MTVMNKFGILSATSAILLTAGFAMTATPAKAEECKTERAKNNQTASRVVGGLLGGFLGRSRLGVAGISIGGTFNGVLLGGIACKLDKPEREKAANATREVVAQPVGTTESWTSDTRENVEGSSTVTNEAELADGSTCKDVRDVATINGEETVVTKRMCRSAGASAYTLQLPTA
jgi:hypothetical protein